MLKILTEMNETNGFMVYGCSVSYYFKPVDDPEQLSKYFLDNFDRSLGRCNRREEKLFSLKDCYCMRSVDI